MSKNVVPMKTRTEEPPENPNRLSFTLEEMLEEFNNGQVPRSKYWKELITALYDTANHVVTGVTSVAEVKPDNVGNIPLLPKDIEAPPMVRMEGADERERQSTEDVFGRQLFYGDACKVVHQYGHYYEVLAGPGYVAGIKFSYPGMQELLIDGEDLPVSVWVDVSQQGNAMSDIQPVVEVVITNEDQKDFIDSNGVWHWLVNIAGIWSNGYANDLRITNAGAASSITHQSVTEAVNDTNLGRSYIKIANGADYLKVFDSNAFYEFPDSGKFIDKSGFMWIYNSGIKLVSHIASTNVIEQSVLNDICELGGEWIVDRLYSVTGNIRLKSNTKFKAMKIGCGFVFTEDQLEENSCFEYNSDEFVENVEFKGLTLKCPSLPRKDGWEGTIFCRNPKGLKITGCTIWLRRCGITLTTDNDKAGYDVVHDVCIENNVFVQIDQDIRSDACLQVLTAVHKGTLKNNVMFNVSAGSCARIFETSDIDGKAVPSTGWDIANNHFIRPNEPYTNPSGKLNALYLRIAESNITKNTIVNMTSNFIDSQNSENLDSEGERGRYSGNTFSKNVLRLEDKVNWSGEAILHLRNSDSIVTQNHLYIDFTNAEQANFPILSKWAERTKISDNIIKTTGYRAISLISSSARGLVLKDSTISDNIIETGGSSNFAAIRLTALGQDLDVSISNNRITASNAVEFRKSESDGVHGQINLTYTDNDVSGQHFLLRYGVPNFVKTNQPLNFSCLVDYQNGSDDAPNSIVGFKTLNKALNTLIPREYSGAPTSINVEVQGDGSKQNAVINYKAAANVMVNLTGDGKTGYIATSNTVLQGIDIDELTINADGFSVRIFERDTVSSLRMNNCIFEGEDSGVKVECLSPCDIWLYGNDFGSMNGSAVHIGYLNRALINNCNGTGQVVATQGASVVLFGGNMTGEKVEGQGGVILEK